RGASGAAKGAIRDEAASGIRNPGLNINGEALCLALSGLSSPLLIGFEGSDGVREADSGYENRDRTEHTDQELSFHFPSVPESTKNSQGSVGPTVGCKQAPAGQTFGNKIAPGRHNRVPENTPLVTWSVDRSVDESGEGAPRGAPAVWPYLAARAGAYSGRYGPIRRGGAERARHGQDESPGGLFDRDGGAGECHIGDVLTPVGVRAIRRTSDRRCRCIRRDAEWSVAVLKLASRNGLTSGHRNRSRVLSRGLSPAVVCAGSRGVRYGGDPNQHITEPEPGKLASCGQRQAIIGESWLRTRAALQVDAVRQGRTCQGQCQSDRSQER